MRHFALLILLLTLPRCSSDDAAPASVDPAVGSTVSLPDGISGRAPKAERAAEGPPAAQATDELAVFEQSATVRDPSDTFLFLREGPGTSADTLARMPNGSAIYVSSCEPGTEGRRWCRVVFSGQAGWAHESGLLVKGAPPDAPPNPFRLATVSDPDGWTNLRGSPSAGRPIIGRLDNGTPVTVGECIPPVEGSRTRWCPIDARTPDGETPSGWIAESRLRYE